MNPNPSNDITVPRPSTTVPPHRSPIPAPSEESFTHAFGPLLPSAHFLQTTAAKIAYYPLPPTQSPTTTAATPSPARVLLLHGVQTPALGMLPLTLSLRNSFPTTEFVLVDLYGHGLSATPLLPHVPALFHTLIDEVLDALHWSSAHLVGYSFGAVTVAGYVASRPERAARVQSLSLIAPAGLLRSEDFPAEHLRGDDEVLARKWVMQTLEGGDLVVPGDWKERVARGEVVAEAVKDWQLREHAGHAASVVAIFRDGGALDGRDHFAGAAGTGVPCVVVWGERDGMSSEGELRELGVRDVRVVEGAGHAVVRERAGEVAGLVGGFWDGLERKVVD